MDIKQIQELVKLINKSNIGELTIEENGVKITIKQKKESVQNTIVSTAPQQAVPIQVPVKTDSPKTIEPETKDDVTPPVTKIYFVIKIYFTW